MTQDENDLLLKDICGRLPYNPMVEYKGEIYNVLGITHGRLVLCKPFMSYTLDEYPLVKEVKLYLFPISSLTEEQLHQWRDEWWDDLAMCVEVNYPKSEEFQVLAHSKSIEWLNKRHIDYRGLIEKGLAIDATGLNIY